MSRLLLLAVGLLSAVVHAQASREAAEIIAKARPTLGKEEALAKVRNLQFHGKLLDKDDKPAQSFILEVAEGGKRREFRYNNEYTLELGTVTNGSEAWIRRTNLVTNQSEPARVLPFEVAGNLREMGKSDLAFYTVPEGAKAEVTTRKDEKVDGKDVVSVTYAHRGGYTYVRHFDAKTHALVATDYPRTGGDFERQIEVETQEAEGVRFPKKTRVVNAKGETLGTLLIEKVKVNVDLGANAFDFPVR